MKKNYKKIIVGIILSISIIGIGTIIYLDKTSTPELEVVIDESVLEAESTEVISPEEEIEEVEVTEEKPQGKKLNAYDAQKFLASQAAPTSVATNKYWEEKPVVEEVIEPETVENVVINEEPVASTETSNNIIYSEPIGTGNTTPVDFTSSSNLQVVKADADSKIHAECGGGNENTGFILEPDVAYITYHGKQDFVQCSVSVVGDKVSVVINTKLNDIAWNCIGATLSELFPNGYTLATAMKNDCVYGNGGYGAENEWVMIDGISSTVKTMSENEVGAAAYGSIIYIFKR